MTHGLNNGNLKFLPSAHPKLLVPSTVPSDADIAGASLTVEVADAEPVPIEPGAERAIPDIERSAEAAEDGPLARDQVPIRSNELEIELVARHRR